MHSFYQNLIKHLADVQGENSIYHSIKGGLNYYALNRGKFGLETSQNIPLKKAIARDR